MEKMKSLTDILREVEDILQKESIVDGAVICEDIPLEGSHGDLIVEKKDKFPQIPGTRYSFRKDNPRGIPGPGNQQHIHIYAPDNKQLFAINIDGSAHDGCHGAKIPEEIAKFLISKGFNVPENRIIEWYPYPFASGKALLFD